jgi:hypothetical protein
VLAFYNVQPGTEADLPAGRQVEKLMMKITTNAEQHSVCRILADRDLKMKFYSSASIGANRMLCAGRVVYRLVL